MELCFSLGFTNLVECLQFGYRSAAEKFFSLLLGLCLPGFILVIEWLEKRWLDWKDTARASRAYLLFSHRISPPDFASTLGKLLVILQRARLGLGFDE